MALMLAACHCLPSCAAPVAPPALPAEGAATAVAAAAGPGAGAASDEERRLLHQALHLGARYLVDACGPAGRFEYIINLDPEVAKRGGYNILRHAGTMYALASYHRKWPRPETAAALGRAARYLNRHVAPLPDDPATLAVWSTTAHEHAKLGAAGLALVALTSMTKTRRGGELRLLDGIAAFTTYMQKSNGSYHSKYARRGGRDDSWTSLYYPGEAALGLLLHAASHASPRTWASPAIEALMYLAHSRRGSASVPPDHWALIATRQALAVGDASLLSGDVVDMLEVHARQIVDRMLRGRANHTRDSPLHGCFGPAGRTTPTATRLEGLLAAVSFLDGPEDASLRLRARSAIDDGIDFLLRAQRQSGPHAGAVPRAIRRLDDEDEHSRFKRRATDVRIDYVQHAMSAWLGYDELLGKTSARTR